DTERTGGPRDDKNIAAFSPGEYLVNAKATREAPPGLLDAINDGRLKSFANGGALMPQGGFGGGQGQIAAAPVIELRQNVINAFDAGSYLSAALDSPEGEQSMLNFLSARPAAVNQALQG
ncbi:MAG: hypothetical protein OEQ29_09580, partial [Alphaproteobacteria bacterium]|nr:hypothetical protein [Alphaproteobacteria bacterium]